ERLHVHELGQLSVLRPRRRVRADRDPARLDPAALVGDLHVVERRSASCQPEAGAHPRLLGTARHGRPARGDHLRDRPRRARARLPADARDGRAGDGVSSIAPTANVIRLAFAAGVTDYRAIFTWRSWALGWMVRVIAQVSFFGLIGLRVANDRSAFYLLIGIALAVAAQAGIFSLNMTTTERWAGTLPLLVASPTSPVVVFAARCAYLAVDGALSAVLALFIAGPLFGLHLPWPRVLAAIPLTGLVAL